MPRFNFPASIDLFYEELIAGCIGSLRARPALISDVFEIYCAWCHMKQVPSVACASAMTKILLSRTNVHTARKRYSIGNLVYGPHAILYLAPVDPARPGFEQDWLGTHVSAFRAAVATFNASRQITRAEHVH